MLQIDESDAAAGVGNGKLVPHDAGVNSRWHLVGPPHMQRFLAFKPAVSDDSDEDGNGSDGSDGSDGEEDVGFALSGVAASLVGGPSFVKFIEAITGCTLTHSRHAVRRFRPGLDYTVAHFGAISSDETLDMSLCFVGGDDAAWDDGELGGFECYMPADDASNARASAEVYTAEGEGVLSLSAAFNSLNLVKRGANTLKFTKCPPLSLAASPRVDSCSLSGTLAAWPLPVAGTFLLSFCCRNKCFEPRGAPLLHAACMIVDDDVNCKRQKQYVVEHRHSGIPE